jgi:hypothetical protein
MNGGNIADVNGCSVNLLERQVILPSVSAFSLGTYCVKTG